MSPNLRHPLPAPHMPASCVMDGNGFRPFSPGVFHFQRNPSSWVERVQNSISPETLFETGLVQKEIKVL